MSSIPPNEKEGFSPNGHYKVTETARLLGVTRNTLFRWDRDGKPLKRRTKKNVNEDFYLGRDIQRFWEAER